jgi:hypothetical protein
MKPALIALWLSLVSFTLNAQPPGMPKMPGMEGAMSNNQQFLAQLNAIQDLDIRSLKKDGLFNAKGQCSVHWSADDKPTGSIGLDVARNISGCSTLGHQPT